MPVEFQQIGRLPTSDDNVAIATRIIDAGTAVAYGGTTLRISHTVLEGHRFAIRPIHQGEALTSWGQAFGTAITGINPGDYVRNEAVLTELGRRSLDFELPNEPNFADDIPPFIFDVATFQPADKLPHYGESQTFMGFRRSGGRGVGTRNMIVLLGTSSLTAGFIRALETHLKPLAAGYANIDAIVAIAHTEGGHAKLNNRDLLLRTLAGFMTHPNVGAVLAVDYGTEAVNNQLLQAYMERYDYPLSHVPHRFMSLSGSFQDSLDGAAQIVSGWLNEVNSFERTAEPLSNLKIALQCGGSDAFSGVSGNPLAAWVAREIIRYGGSANLAETDELIGAETYILDKVKDINTANKFLHTVNRFVERAGQHGHSAAGNPSGGNVYRGLYNIYLKSLGAAAKRHPDVRVDAVIDYGEPMREPGFYFMDSPGNDLESIAGQVASGCNLIYFVTGNGSITNFPFVPTIKIVTTTQRYELLPNEMDVNAGAYLDGTPLDTVGKETLELTVDVACGQATVGEAAHHAQVQIWRDWRQTTKAAVPAISPPSGKPIPLSGDVTVPDVEISMYRTADGYASNQVGLILPTSLCSGQIARMCANQLNELGLGRDQGISSFVTLVHTEGCGASTETEFISTLLGYMKHPLVSHCLSLEHGCEKTHNGYMRHLMLEAGLDPAQFGWASVQLDGGIQAVLQKMTGWFSNQLAQAPQPDMVTVGLETVRLGLLTRGAISDSLAAQLGHLTHQIVAAGGRVILPQQDNLLAATAYLPETRENDTGTATLAYAQQPANTGFHIMQRPSDHWGETLTGLGATGVELILAVTDSSPLASHPLVPVLQVTENAQTAQRYQADFDAVLSDGEIWSEQLIQLIVSVLSRDYIPQQNVVSNVDFQITRGLLGVSL